MPLPTTFHIKRGDQLLAVLDLCQNSEMFWQTCRFTPTEAFEEVRPFFEAFSNSQDDAELYQALDHLGQLGLMLVDVESGYTTPDFFAHIHGNQCELRFA